MGELFQPWHIILLFSIFFIFFLLPAIFYILTLQRALNKCSPASRTLEPALVWLYLVPLVNLVFNFFIVLAMAKTLRNEFNRRGAFVADPTPGQSIGLAMSIAGCCTMIPFLGVLALLAQLVLWIIYWTKIAEYSRILDVQPEISAQAPAL
jgi:hypothetical protein